MSAPVLVVPQAAIAGTAGLGHSFADLLPGVTGVPDWRNLSS